MTVPQEDNDVIAVCLQAACLRAAATIMQASRSLRIEPRDIDHYARELYACATERPWMRGAPQSSEA
jgi:hypothetical protein